MKAAPFLMFLLIALLQCGCRPMGVRLHYGMGAHEESRYILKNEQTVRSGVGDNEHITSRTISTITFYEKVRERRKDGSLVIDLTYRSVNILQHMNGKDTELPVDDIEGRTVNYTISRQGKVMEWEGKDIAEAPVEVRQSLGRNAEFPDRSLKPGDSWQITSELEIPPSDPPETIIEKHITTYTFEGIEKIETFECARIRFSTEAGRRGSGNSPQEGGGGEAEGTIYFSLKKGRLVRSEARMTMTQNSTITRKGKKRQITCKTTEDISISLVK